MVKDGSLNPEKPIGSQESLTAFIAKKEDEIKELWNPKNPNKFREDSVLSSIVDVSKNSGVSSQVIAGWIYGKNEVDIENLDSLA